MKNFFKNIFLFILPLVLFPVFFEWMIYKMKTGILSEKNLETNLKKDQCDYQWVQKISHPHKIFLLGSSTVKYGLSCSLLNKLSSDSLSFINLADNARDPVATYFILSGLDLTGVKAMYMGMDPWIYPRLYYRSRPDILYNDLSFQQSVFYFRDQDRQVFLKRWKNFIKYVFYKSGTASCSSDGQEIPGDFGSLILDKRPQNFGNSIQKRFQLGKYGWSELQFIYLGKIAELCRRKNIFFSIVIPPKRSDFNQAYKNYCRDIHRDFLSKLMSIHLEMPVIGKFDQLTASGDSSLFADAYHLNGEGQRVYSRLFYKMMQSKTITPINFSYSWFDK